MFFVLKKGRRVAKFSNQNSQNTKNDVPSDAKDSQSESDYDDDENLS